MQAKMPPHDLEAEKSVLGAIMIDKDAIVNVAEILRTEYFYEENNQHIYAAMVSLYEKRQPIDVVTLTDQLKHMKKLTTVGGASAVVEISNSVSTAANAVNYARIIKGLAIKRGVIKLAGELSELAFDESKEVQQVIDVAEQRIFELSQNQTQRAFIPIKEALAESFERLDELQRNSGEFRGVATGFTDLDNLLAGLQKSNLIILAARPGIGKTAFALNMAQFAAVSGKKKIGFFSLEMSKEELVDRLLVAQADIDAWRLKTGRLDQQDFLKLSDAMGVLADANIFIDDTPGSSVFEMRTKARRLMSEQGIDLIVVDYLQLARGRTIDNRVQEVAEISQGLKNIARELRVPVIALSQLSRAIESRGEKTPQLSDLRESGCLAGDTLIYLPDTGQSVPIRELSGQSGFRVLSLNTGTYKLEPATVTHAFCTGTKPVYRLTTQLGRTIQATGNHKFLTIEGWRRVDELKTDDRLAIPRQLLGTELQTMSDAELGLLGHLIGDGCTLPRHAIQYTTREPDLAKIVTRCAKEVFGEKISPRTKKERQWLQVYFTSTAKLTHGKHNPITDWLTELGVFGLRSHEKLIPKKVFEQPNKAIALFLRHLWSTDGCIRSYQSRPAVYYASSSQQLAVDVQTLLLRLGINARLRRVPQKAKGKDQYHVVVTGNQDLRSFVDLVGAIGEYKQKGLDSVHTYIDSCVANTNRDIIPVFVWQEYALPAMQANGLSQRKMQSSLGMSYCGTSLYNQNLSRERAKRVAEAVQSETLAQLAESDVYWDQIASIELDGESDVYDLTVPQYSNFVANNITAHNSIEQDADVVMFLYRKDDDIRESVNLKIAKHRNGPLGEVDLYFKGDRIKFFGMDVKR